MAWLADGEKISKISLFVLATHERDRQTDIRTDRHGVPAIATLMHSIARQKCAKVPLIYQNAVGVMPNVLYTNPILSVSNATGVPNVPKMTKNNPIVPKIQLVYQMM